jgi:hypothetical protein
MALESQPRYHENVHILMCLRCLSESRSLRMPPLRHEVEIHE